MRVPALIFLLAAACWASPILISDPFPGSTWPAAGYDVAGARTDFDIQWMEGLATPSVSTFELAFNTRHADLRPFQVSGIRLGVGDLLFEVDGAFKYGVPLASHAGSGNGGPAGLPVGAGQLYRIEDASRGLLTARQALNDPRGAVYRPEEEVWLRDDGQGSLRWLAAGSVAVALFGDGTANAEYRVRVQFETPIEFWDDLGRGGMRMHFSNATCGNDVAEGALAAPESGTNLMIGGGLVALGLVSRYLRKRAGRQ